MNLIKKKNIIQQQFKVLQKPPVNDQDIYVRSSPYNPLWKLAQEYYNDPNLWILIARANDLNEPIVEDGRVLRIPMGVQQRYIQE